MHVDLASVTFVIGLFGLTFLCGVLIDMLLFFMRFFFALQYAQFVSPDLGQSAARDVGAQSGPIGDNSLMLSRMQFA